MSDSTDQAALSALFREAFGVSTPHFETIKEHASKRRIYRLRDQQRSVIGVVNPDRAENRAFVEFAKHFKKNGLPVPEIYCSAQDWSAYLEEDLGDLTLLDRLQCSRDTQSALSDALLALYREALEQLCRFQLVAGRGLDYSFCYQGADFDRSAVLGDLRDFREQLLQPKRIAFDAERLQSEFDLLANQIASYPAHYFMYRDFQARNIMLLNGRCWFIDFQSGRRGPLQYDVASLVYQSAAALAPSEREALVRHYLAEACKLEKIDTAQFVDSLPTFAIIRLMQALSAYGRAGLRDGKEYFIKSIPSAAKMLTETVQQSILAARLPEVLAVASKLST
ncbi:MAG: phosphotransferase [Oligoflexia bacterium]|nr:phosphotransferase [Oligoflexia bacterium]